ncbi:type 1 fimbrial protein [Escherichia coli]|nr:type 1 fimbrial protein [Escherichia coli]EHC9922808.1 type 1 fimbrial protein [Escherichia coli]HAI5814709.1 type 1 fimbrial protein [Escherichia coli]HAI6675033.1 type 1 fimbrial protein [Escherichia coli]HAM6278155.1 type 1 fimbrial protein [Escherichia coli]
MLDRPCHVSGDSLNKHVVFKTRASRDFWYPPGRSPTESFVIRLENCHATAVGKIVTLTFKGTEEAALPGHLKVTGVNAGRLGIALLDTDGSSLLKPGTSHNKGQGEKVTGNSLELPFGAYVVATPEALRTKSVVPGDYEATATFELTYR